MSDLASSFFYLAVLYLTAEINFHFRVHLKMQSLSLFLFDRQSILLKKREMENEINSIARSSLFQKYKEKLNEKTLNYI